MRNFLPLSSVTTFFHQLSLTQFLYFGQAISIRKPCDDKKQKINIPNPTTQTGQGGGGYGPPDFPPVTSRPCFVLSKLAPPGRQPLSLTWHTTICDTFEGYVWCCSCRLFHNEGTWRLLLHGKGVCPCRQGGQEQPGEGPRSVCLPSAMLSDPASSGTVLGA